ncbi:MAG TPA: class I adenylate-forming enzyme family protein, partial [Acidimicrobiales bacterium]|nr:class I adenylate-forming enzyme family protein [Acidimicrobiales bacterium]
VEIGGHPIRTWKNAPPTLRAVLENSRAHGELGFLVYEDETLTFDEHFRAAAHLAHVLRDRYGVQTGDRVAIAMRNFPEWSIAFWAAAAAGAVVVPLNAWWTGAELRYGLEDSASTVLFLDEERVERLRDELPTLDLKGVIVAKAGDAALPDGVERFEDVLGDVPATVELPDIELHPEDDATIFYTSGTTGFPKGALGTHRNICTNLISLVFCNARAGLRKSSAPDDEALPPAGQNTYLLSVPFFHATGCHSILVANLAFGGKIVIMHKWDPDRALELIEREKVTTFGGVPSMVWQVLEHPEFDKRDTSSVRSIGYGGAPAPPELVKRIEAMFPGRSPSNGYGLTETSSVTTMNAGDDYKAKPKSVGVPVPVCDVQVVDEHGKPVAEGEVGELWIKGPNVVKGYWNKAEATEAAFGGGWFRSGDGATLDDEGFVYIVDRIKDMVIRGGENVYCAEVEAAIFEHPEVSDTAVIGVPHQVLGEEVGAVVVRTPGSTLTAADLQRHVRERLAAFKVPAHIYFRDEPLPRNPAGKVLKRDLKTEVLPS